MSPVVRPFRIRSENTAQRISLAGIIEIHTRIGLQIGLGETEFHAIVGCYDQRQESQSCGIEFRKPGYGIEVLERGFELTPEGYDLGSVTIPNIRDPASPVSRETSAGLFGSDGQRFIRRRDETIGHPVVIGPELDGETRSEIGPQPVVAIRNPRLDIKRRGERGIDGPFTDTERLRRTAPYGSVAQRHRHRSGRHDRPAVHTDFIGAPLSDGQCNPDRLIRRKNRITFFTNCECGNAKQCK